MTFSLSVVQPWHFPQRILPWFFPLTFMKLWTCRTSVQIQVGPCPETKFLSNKTHFLILFCWIFKSCTPLFPSYCSSLFFLWLQVLAFNKTRRWRFSKWLAKVCPQFLKSPVCRDVFFFPVVSYQMTKYHFRIKSSWKTSWQDSIWSKMFQFTHKHQVLHLSWKWWAHHWILLCE